jgi:2'-5' RNA ligase
LAVLVPAAELLVGPFRDRYDPSGAAGTPTHITLLYPFKPPVEIDQIVLDKLRECFSRFQPIAFSLSAIRRFHDGVLYLIPEPDEPFRLLTLAIWDSYPETPPYSGRYSRVVPHLTVAQLADEHQAEQVAIEFARASRRQLPIHATAAEIALMDTMTGSWQVRATFALR